MCVFNLFRNLIVIMMLLYLRCEIVIMGFCKYYVLVGDGILRVVDFF